MVDARSADSLARHLCEAQGIPFLAVGTNQLALSESVSFTKSASGRGNTFLEGDKAWSMTDLDGIETFLLPQGRAWFHRMARDGQGKTYPNASIRSMLRALLSNNLTNSEVLSHFRSVHTANNKTFFPHGVWSLPPK
eukprot:m.15498 g.15498  ORF g.15498 m.15498 type:complete len:137 (+) comp6637_c0_seq1:182-592(+)